MSARNTQAPPHWFSEAPPPQTGFLGSVGTFTTDNAQLCLFLGVALVYLALRFYGHLICQLFCSLFNWLNSPRPVYIVDRNTGRPLEVAQPAPLEPAEPAAEGGARGPPPPPPAGNWRS